MTTFLPKDDLELQQAFGKILFTEKFSAYINEIAELVYTSELDKSNLEKILKEHRIKQITDVKKEILELILSYINVVLNDNVITESEAGNVKLLKRIFKINEGDFYNHCYHKIEAVLNRQFERIYGNDDKIDEVEALHKVGLQELFDLSYDQFLEFVDKEVKSALERGASLTELDTVFKVSYSSKNKDIAS